MRRLALLAVAAAVVAFPVAPAHAAPDPSGVLCNVLTSTDATTTVYAGPLDLVDADQPGVVSGRVTCTLQMESRHADPDLGSVTSDSMTGAVVLPPTELEVAPWDYYYVCTRIDVDGGPTLYYDFPAGEWSADPLVGCQAPDDVVEPCPTDGSCPPSCLDGCLCPVFAMFFEPDGDIVLPDPVGPVWDCPPYRDWGAATGARGGGG